MEKKENENVFKVYSKKKSKQDRRLVETKQVTPTHDVAPTSGNNNNHIIAKTKLPEKSSEKEVIIILYICKLPYNILSNLS